MKILTHDNLNSLGVFVAIVVGAWTPAKDWLERGRHQAYEVQEAIDRYWQSPSDTGAVERINQLRSRLPENVKLKTIEGVVHLQSGDYAKALPVFSEVIDVEPSNLQALTGLGKVFVERQEAGHAIRYLEQARELFDEPGLLIPPRNRENVLLLLGKAYADAGRYEEAERVAVAAEALPSLPPNPAAHILLGHIYRLRQNFILASEQYQRAVELQPVRADLRYALIRSWADAGQLEAEVERLEGLIGRDAAALYNPAVGDVLLDAYQFLERHDRALKLQSRKDEYFRLGRTDSP